ncbi:hypothetical protein [Aquibacillus saliphilus]|uniref:hypothetical protein n=1 Tax=Aquibacillus saliphilus TaxID=1909422 RepID=UPI001CF0C5DD|nr:hypothetical protein [Aquibacillus saliphilus]
MAGFEGSIFSGNYSNDDHSFYLKKVKQLDTESTLSIKQIGVLKDYLSRQSELGDSCTITVNDQIPLLLKEEEVDVLLKELNTISENL